MTIGRPLDALPAVVALFDAALAHAQEIRGMLEAQNVSADVAALMLMRLEGFVDMLTEFHDAYKHAVAAAKRSPSSADGRDLDRIRDTLGRLGTAVDDSRQIANTANLREGVLQRLKMVPHGPAPMRCGSHAECRSSRKVERSFARHVEHAGMILARLANVGMQEANRLARNGEALKGVFAAVWCVGMRSSAELLLRLSGAGAPTIDELIGGNTDFEELLNSAGHGDIAEVLARLRADTQTIAFWAEYFGLSFAEDESR